MGVQKLYPWEIKPNDVAPLAADLLAYITSSDSQLFDLIELRKSQIMQQLPALCHSIVSLIEQLPQDCEVLERFEVDHSILQLMSNLLTTPPSLLVMADDDHSSTVVLVSMFRISAMLFHTFYQPLIVGTKCGLLPAT